MDKAGLRQDLVNRRKSMPTQDVRVKSKAIAEKLMATIEWPKIDAVHVYQSVAGWKEVDTSQINKQLSAAFPAINIVRGSLEKDAPFPAKEFDLIIVPVLGFDKNLYRLGLGGGWYDRFLAAQPQALKVGLAYHFALIKDGLPHEAHDIPLDMIITERAIMVNHADK